MASGKNKPIVVAQIMGKMNGGGVESVIMNYYRHIDRSKVQFDFICDEDSTNIPYEEIKKLGGHVILCPPYQKLFKYMNFLEDLFRKKKYRIVHSNINTLSVFPLRSARKAGVPVRIAHSHSASNRREWKKHFLKAILKKQSRRYATDYFACTMHAGRYQFGDRRNDIVIVTNVIDTDRYKYDKNARTSIRNQLGFSENDYVIGSVGRLEAAKNHLFLIDAFYEFRKNNRAKLLIIGDGKERGKIERQVKKKNLTGDVIIEHFKDNINEYYSAMDILALPSLYEGLGMVAVEAQINGLPVLASKNVPEEANIGGLHYRELKAKNFLEVAHRTSGYFNERYDSKHNAMNLGNIYIERGMDE